MGARLKPMSSAVHRLTHDRVERCGRQVGLPGDRVIIMHWAHMTDAEYADHHPTCPILDEHNDIERTIHYGPDVLIPQPVR